MTDASHVKAVALNDQGDYLASGYDDGVRIRPDAREELVLAAERLVGERGISVSLREVASAAGQRNNSAVAYHFGSKDDLVAAIVARRLGTIEAERAELLATDDADSAAASPADEVRRLVRLVVKPMAVTPYAEGSTHYARFLEKVRDHPAVVEMPLTGDRWPATRAVTVRLDRALGDLPFAVRRQRLAAMTTVMFALLADAERRGEPGLAATEAAVIDMLVGLLTAPVGAAAVPG